MTWLLGNPDFLVRFARTLLAVAVTVLFLCAAAARAQTDAVEARVSSVKGAPTLSGVGIPPHTLVRGDILKAGEEIDTRSGGEMTIELSDGSMVIVRPGSLILLKDFNSASSLRELFELLVGRVRVKINHYAGRPNPYRINSPTASIAVRGTEFSVSVGATGTTEVSVYEGVVEVTNLADPEKKVLVHPGQWVIVRPGQEIRFFIRGPWQEPGNFNGSEDPGGRNAGGNSNADDHQPDIPGLGSPRDSAGIYNETIENLVAPKQNPLYTRFAAYPDSFLDSLENPAYTTEFQRAQGRLYLLPVFNGVQAPDSQDTLPGPTARSPFDYGLSPQAFYFTPLADKRTAVGGGVVGLRNGVQSLGLDESTALTGPFFPPGTTGTRTTSASNDVSLLTGTFALSHAFGRNRQTSLGVGVDHSRSWGTLRNSIMQADTTGLTANENVVSATSLAETRFKVGFTHDFSSRSKLGFYYDYGVFQGRLRDRSHLVNGVAQPLDFANNSGHLSEIGLRFRGVLTSRLFYGIEASGFATTLNRRLQLSTISDSHAQEKSTGGIATFGLGYALRPRILLSFDFSGGVSSVSFRRTEDVTRNILELRHTSSPFLSSHEAVQADVWRRLFVSTSLLTMWRSNRTNLNLYPDRFGRFLTTAGVFAPNGKTVDRNFYYYSEYGAGWRFNEHFTAEYVYSTTYGVTPASHLILLQYTFSKREK
jgi:hypothetical protein